MSNQRAVNFLIYIIILCTSNTLFAQTAEAPNNQTDNNSDTKAVTQMTDEELRIKKEQEDVMRFHMKLYEQQQKEQSSNDKATEN